MICNDILLILNYFIWLIHEKYDDNGSVFVTVSPWWIGSCLNSRLHVVATTGKSTCPFCTEVATYVRSYYTRLVADLPCAGHRVQIMLHLRKFRCDTISCPRKIFTERLGSFVEAWARKTTRLREVIEPIGLATCGEGDARLAYRLAMMASPSTVLRCIMALPLPTIESVSHLGIDPRVAQRATESQ